MVQNLLLEDPWPVALTLIIVAAVLSFLAVQRGNNKLLRFARLAVLVAVAVFVLAGLITTTRERIIAQTERLVSYTAPLQIDSFKSLVDPRVTVSIEESGGSATLTGQSVFDSLEKTVSGQALEGQTILSIDANVKSDEDATSAFEVRTDVRGGRFMTRWILTWRKQPDGVWRVVNVQWIDCPGLLGIKPSRQWLR